MGPKQKSSKPKESKKEGISKKQEKVESKKKQVLSFQQRFKDKRNAIGKAGLFDVLDMHEPFTLDEPVRKEEKPPKFVQTHNKDQDKKNRKLVPKGNKTEDQINKKSVTPPYNRRKSQSQPELSVKLPEIHQSTPILPPNKGKINPERYWGSVEKLNNKLLLKRKASELSCLKLIKMDEDANHHWDYMTKFGKICQTKSKKSPPLKIGNKSNNTPHKNTPQDLQRILLLKTNAQKRHSVPLL